MRLRAYSATFDESDSIFVELKTHHESWVLAKSVKERFAISRRQAERLLAGQLDTDKSDTALRRRVVELVKKRKLEPCVRTVYRRTAFQLSTSNAGMF